MCGPTQIVVGDASMDFAWMDVLVDILILSQLERCVDDEAGIVVSIVTEALALSAITCETSQTYLMQATRLEQEAFGTAFWSHCRFLLWIFKGWRILSITEVITPFVPSCGEILDLLKSTHSGE
jgi:hypothetical protein